MFANNDYYFCATAIVFIQDICHLVNGFVSNAQWWNNENILKFVIRVIISVQWFFCQSKCNLMQAISLEVLYITTELLFSTTVS